MIAGLALVIGRLTAVPRFRQLAVAKLRPQVTAARDNLRELARQPGKLVRAVRRGGRRAAPVRRRPGLRPARLRPVAVAGRAAGDQHAGLALGGIAPVPGGMGVIEAGLIAGVHRGRDPATPIAVAATFTARLFTCYLPPIWGYPTLAYMRHREYL